MYPLEVSTQYRTQLVDITNQVRDVLARAPVKSGCLVVFVPHTTAAVTINENADPDVVRDILHQVNQTIPFEGDYKHDEGNSAAHIKASLFGSSVTVLIEEGRLLLGRWQGIFFCEFDGPRQRNAWVQVLGSSK